MAEIAQYLGTGKRKTSVARVILRPGDGKTWINGRTLEDYFPRASHRTAALGPLKTAGAEGTYDLRVRVHGGGISGQAGAVRHGIARALVEADPELRVASEARGLPHARCPPGGAQEGRSAQGTQSAAVLETIRTLPVGRGATSPRAPPCRPVRRTPWLVLTSEPMACAGSSATRSRSTSSSGSAAPRRCGRGAGRVFVGRDTRGSGPALEEALVHGIVSAGGIAVLGGVLPTPAVALLAQDLGVVLSASHNPPEYNGVKLFDAEGHKLSDADEEAIEALLDARRRRAVARSRWRNAAADGYVEHILEHFGSRLDGLRIAVDCANGAYSAIAPGVFERLGAEVTTVAATPDGSNINVGCGATDLGLLQEVVRAGGLRPRGRVRR